MSESDDVFQALADPTRRGIIHLLATEGKQNLNTIAAGFSISRPAISRHVRVLEKSRLVQIHKSGRKRICSLNPDKLMEVARWADAQRTFWNNRLDRLDEIIRGNNPESDH